MLSLPILVCRMFPHSYHLPDFNYTCLDCDVLLDIDSVDLDAYHTVGNILVQHHFIPVLKQIKVWRVLYQSSSLAQFDSEFVTVISEDRWNHNLHGVDCAVHGILCLSLRFGRSSSPNSHRHNNVIFDSKPGSYS